jgi:serine/threonine-protein kinase RsbW
VTDPSATESVELRIPASAEWLALARTTGAAIASRWSFTYDEIADLRLAIDELCLTLVEGATAEQLQLTYSLEGETLQVVGLATGFAAASNAAAAETEGPHGIPIASADLSARILDALVDEHGLKDEKDGRKAWLRKQRGANSP